MIAIRTREILVRRSVFPRPSLFESISLNNFLDEISITSVYIIALQMVKLTANLLWTMKNVTEIFNKAVSGNVDWRLGVFNDVLSTLIENSINISFWQNEENWASVLVNNQIVGYIWRKFPLIAFENNTSIDLPFLLQKFNVINYIGVDSLNKSLLKVDEKKLTESIDSIWNSESFTIEDLWFRTNTI